MLYSMDTMHENVRMHGFQIHNYAPIFLILEYKTDYTYTSI